MKHVDMDARLKHVDLGAEGWQYCEKNGSALRQLHVGMRQKQVQMAANE